ncbi:MAG: sulfotransferase, partial [Proteobacteria bacterium]|nr:sulfotransferase [Pseudomonadota bacterium]
DLFDGFTRNNKVILQQLNYLYSTKANNKNLNTQTDGVHLIFMIGFPRSGTTLLETSLDKHKKIQVLEETKEIANIFNHLCNNNPKNYSNKIQSMGSDDFNVYAKAYLNRIKQYIQWNEHGFVIDKMPMNTVYVDLISRLFPKAKIIFSARHCYDVCLSNFFQKDIHLYNMDEVFSIYDSVLSIWKLAKDHIGLDVTTCFYENLINDNQAELINMLNFIGLEPSALDQSQDHQRMVSTPSYAQVNEPIYQTSINRYQNYLPFFSKNLSVIDKWVNFFNYETIA